MFRCRINSFRSGWRSLHFQTSRGSFCVWCEIIRAGEKNASAVDGVFKPPAPVDAEFEEVFPRLLLASESWAGTCRCCCRSTRSDSCSCYACLRCVFCSLFALVVGFFFASVSCFSLLFSNTLLLIGCLCPLPPPHSLALTYTDNPTHTLSRDI